MAKRYTRRRRNAWRGHRAGHARAVRPGWRRRKRARSNPLWRRAGGRYVGRKVPGARKLRRTRRGGWRNPWITGYSYTRPRATIRVPKHWRKSRRRRKARKNPGNPLVGGYSYRRRGRRVRVPRYWRRRVRRNPYHLKSNPLEAITGAFEDAFSGETLETMLHTGLGIGGTLIGTKLLSDVLPDVTKTDIGRVAASVGVSVVGSGLAGMLTKDRALASRFLVGGMIASFLQLLGIVVPAGSEARAWIPTVGLGAEETAEFRKAIEEEVLKELRSAGAAGMGVYLTPAGAEQMYVAPAGAQAYLTQKELAKTVGMGAYLTAREGQALETGMGYRPTEEIGPAGMPERF